MGKSKNRQARYITSIKCKHCKGTGKRIQEEIQLEKGIKELKVDCEHCGGQGWFTKKGTA